MSSKQKLYKEMKKYRIRWDFEIQDPSFKNIDSKNYKLIKSDSVDRGCSCVKVKTRRIKTF